VNLGHLRTFETVARSGSFTAAARRLRVTPAAVSLQMRLFERACGVRLFDRVGRRILVAPAGRMLRDYAQRMVALETDAERALQHVHGLTKGVLRIVSSETAATYYLAPLWTAFQRRYPGVHVQLALENSQRVTERLLALEDDVGVLGIDTPPPELVLETLIEDPLVVVVPPAHRWARRRALGLDALAGEPLILREAGSASRRLLERQLAAAGVRYRAVMEIASNELIKRAVELGMGIAILSAAVVAREVAYGTLRAVAIADERFIRPLYVAYHRERASTPAIQALVALAREFRGRSPAGRRRRR
jgi:LysR family transcriptional regulator, low CO2-responsive transcriptional regulator